VLLGSFLEHLWQTTSFSGSGVVSIFVPHSAQKLVFGGNCVEQLGQFISFVVSVCVIGSILVPHSVQNFLFSSI
jgi:NhaP-type Na+/H+ or K+/H+ antiporter